MNKARVWLSCSETRIGFASWGRSKWGVRSADRNWDAPEARNSNQGFRLAQDYQGDQTPTDGTRFARAEQEDRDAKWGL